MKSLKWYGKYGRKVGWIVKWFGKYERKVSWKVKRFGKYGRKVGWIVKWDEKRKKPKLNSDKIWKIQKKIVKRQGKYGWNV
jgi:hypothetical protein